MKQEKSIKYKVLSIKYKVSSIKYFFSPIILIILTTYFLILNTGTAGAFTMSNDNFTIDMGNFNSGSGKASSSRYKVLTTTGQTGAGQYTGKNYKVKAGFEYIYPLSSSFSFSISESLIDFGPLSATTPVIRKNTLTVTTATPLPYQVLAYEDHPLLAPSNATIPDTTCDNGSCDESRAAPWTNTLTYGFGYRCDNLIGKDCAPDFAEANAFRHFADNSKREIYKAVMKGSGQGKKSEAQITYKVNISGTQLPGMYINSIYFIASPGF